MQHSVGNPRAQHCRRHAFGHDVPAAFPVISLLAEQLVAADMPVCAHMPPIVSSGLRVTSGTFTQHSHTLPLHASGESEVPLDQMQKDGRLTRQVFCKALQDQSGSFWGESSTATWKKQEATASLWRAVAAAWMLRCGQFDQNVSSFKEEQRTAVSQFFTLLTSLGEKCCPSHQQEASHRY